MRCHKSWRRCRHTQRSKFNDNLDDDGSDGDGGKESTTRDTEGHRIRSNFQDGKDGVAMVRGEGGEKADRATMRERQTDRQEERESEREGATDSRDTVGHGNIHWLRLRRVQRARAEHRPGRPPRPSLTRAQRPCGRMCPGGERRRRRGKREEALDTARGRCR